LPPLEIYTIGHSTHRADAFLALLTAHGIAAVADIRTIPQSRRHPHFGKDALQGWLGASGIEYTHFPALGGWRRPRKDSINTAVRHASFRGYADHMQSAEFEAGVLALEAFATRRVTTVMCAEALWWQCHRRFLADALFVRNVKVQHIMSSSAANPHELSAFARVQGQRVTYPGLV
jgi:uncharacterized protein (DUF488 family)